MYKFGHNNKKHYLCASFSKSTIMKHIFSHLMTLAICLLLAASASAQDNNGGVKVNAPKGLATRNNSQLGKAKAETPKTENKTQAPKAQTGGEKTTKKNTGGNNANKPKQQSGQSSTSKAAQKTAYERTNKQSIQKRSVGFRIQAFSDNNYRTAKAAAQSRAKSIAMQFPQYRSYITYNAPTWRLRIGDFANQQEAKAAIAAIRKAFPSFARELTIVRDHINIWQ